MKKPSCLAWKTEMILYAWIVISCVLKKGGQERSEACELCICVCCLSLPGKGLHQQQLWGALHAMARHALEGGDLHLWFHIMSNNVTPSHSSFLPCAVFLCFSAFRWSGGAFCEKHRGTENSISRAVEQSWEGSSWNGSNSFSQTQKLKKKASRVYKKAITCWS